MMNLKQLVIPICRLDLKNLEELSKSTSMNESTLRRISRYKNRIIHPKHVGNVSEKESEKDENWDESTDDEESDTDKENTYDHSSESKVTRGPSKKVEEKSEYEEMIEKKRAERMTLLQSLGLNEAKSNLIQAIGAVKKKNQLNKRSFHRLENTSPPVMRRSSRIVKMKADKAEKAVAEKEEVIPLELPFKNALQLEELYDKFVKDVRVQDSNIESKCVSYNNQVLKKLNLEDSNIVKITPDRTTALTWHPSVATFIVAAGSVHGDLGIWNVDSKSSPYVFKNHLHRITNLQFNPWNLVELISSSYDGTLRSGNMVKHIFTEIYSVAEQTCCTDFDFLSPTTFLVSQSNGQVALVDNRTKEKRCQKTHPCHGNSIKTVSVHPVNNNYFITADNTVPIRLWDLRSLQKNPVVNITYHERGIESAFFSSVTGNYVLTTSRDGKISIFDSTNLTNDIPLKHQMKQKYRKGSWLRAKWLPNSDDAFVLNSMQTPRSIQVFNNKLEIEHALMHENLSLTFFNTFHPFKPALAAASESGRLFVFT